MNAVLQAAVPTPRWQRHTERLPAWRVREQLAHLISLGLPCSLCVVIDPRSIRLSRGLWAAPDDMPLNIVSPTPPDIVIAQSVECRPIMEIAAKLGLQEDDYEPHGHQKAKV